MFAEHIMPRLPSRALQDCTGKVHPCQSGDAQKWQMHESKKAAAGEPLPLLVAALRVEDQQELLRLLALPQPLLGAHHDVMR